MNTDSQRHNTAVRLAHACAPPRASARITRAFACTLALVCVGAMPAHASNASQSTNGFTGSGALQANEQQVSADNRYSINAELQKSDSTQRSLRFELLAKLDPSASAKATSTLCGTAGDDLFANGFE